MTAGSLMALRQAVPYLQLYRAKTFVVKVGGEAFLRHRGAEVLLEQIGVLLALGIRIVLVHGGGAQADALAEQLGVRFEKVDGRRKTSPEMVSVMQKSLHGDVQGDLLSAARKLGMTAVALSGMDAGLVEAEPRPGTALGEVGDVTGVNADFLLGLLDDGVLPMVSPLSGDAEGRWLNINADTVAAEIAVAIQAEKVIFMTGTPGVLDDVNDPNSLISALTLDELKGLAQSGVMAGGMLPKAAAIERCLTGGVPRVHVVSFTLPDALLTEVFTNEGSGTLITVSE